MKRFILSVLFFSIAINCQATSKNQSLSEIRHQVDLFVRSEISLQANDSLTVNVGKIDQRLQLKNCPKDKLQIFNPYPGSISQTSTLGVKCESDDAHWTLYVSVKTQIEKMVLVAKRNLGRGHLISEQDVTLARHDVVPLKYGWFTNKKDVIGKLCKQNIDLNRPISSYMLDKQTLVHKGDLVSIKADKGNIHISIQGKALDKGSQGDIVSVKNTKSKRVVQAEVIGPREVRVTI